MSEEIKNDIDKLDGMVKMKKCGYEFIGGCSDLRRLKQENAKLKEKLEKIKDIIRNCEKYHTCFDCKYFSKCGEVNISQTNLYETDVLILRIIEGAEDD